jgi:hypothetical protein
LLQAVTPEETITIRGVNQNNERVFKVLGLLK